MTWHASTALLPTAWGQRLLLRLLFSTAHVVHVLSQRHAAVAPAHSTKLLVLANDVEIPPKVPPMAARNLHVVFAGAFGHRKGADVLLDAWSQLEATSAKGWSLEIFGAVSPEALTACEQFRSDSSVHLHGITPGEHVQEALRRASVAVLPSRAEAFPMFLLEAMAAGCAIIATSVGAVPELLAKNSGLLVTPGDATALAAAMEALLISFDARESLGDAARRRVQDNYSADFATQQWQRAYMKLTEH